MSEITKLPRRPSFGAVGQRISVVSNYYELTAWPKGNIHHYDLDLNEVPIRAQDRIFGLIEEQHRDKFGGVKPVYDGRANIYSSRALPFDEISLEVALPPTPVHRNEQRWLVKIKKVAEYPMSSLQKMLEARGPFDANCKAALMAMDVVLRMVPSKLHFVRGRCFYLYLKEGSRDRKTRGGVEFYPGYFQSIRPAGNKLAVNVDISAASFFQAVNSASMAAYLLGRESPENLRGRLSGNDAASLGRKMLKLRVKTNHRGEDKARIFMIQGVTDQPCDQCMFTDREGKELSVRDYFEKFYNKKLSYPFLPCLIVNRTRKIYLPMEACDILPGQIYKKKLDPFQTSTMIKFASQRPEARQQRIREGIQRLNYNQNEYLRDFGISVAERPIVAKARVLPPPRVQYSPQSDEREVKPRGGSWNMMRKKVNKGAVIDSWAVVSFCNPKDLPRPAVGRFCSELANICSNHGMVVNARDPYMATPVNPQVSGQIESALRDAYYRAGQQFKTAPGFILCILPEHNAKIYGEVKRVTDTMIGISSQCVLSRHVRDAKAQYCANLVLKLNMKLPQGINHVVAMQQVPFIADRPTIVIGGDVAHAQPGSRAPSIAAVVGSLDKNAVRYGGVVKSQESRVEVIQDLTAMVMQTLRNFLKATGYKPERILFYRDGVSDGQFAEVKNTEVEAIKKACRSLQADFNPPVTFVVVKKGHHTRFFPMTRDDADRSGNLFPGLVVDQDVIHPFEFDFFLQGHSGLQGTCRPAHYYVLHDENNFSADSLQSLTCNLSYTFCRCTRSVSIVPAAYYAHILGGRAKYHVRGGWSESSDTDPSRSGKKSGGSQSGVTDPTSTSVQPLVDVKCPPNIMYYV